jgi:hypothetical protein
MAELFDMRIRAMRRDRAARSGVELFLYERAFADCLERIELMQRQFERALLVGCPDRTWATRLRALGPNVQILDPGALFADAAGGSTVVEDAWLPPEQGYDLIVSVGTLDTVNDLPLALRLTSYSLSPGGLLIGAMAGGETLPRLREAMRAADEATGAAAPHVHPRIDPSALSSLLGEAGFADQVVDIDRVNLSYQSIEGLVRDLRVMGLTNVLAARPHFIGKAGRTAAANSFFAAGRDGRTTETIEILHFAAWAAHKPAGALTL